jgi:hypothetical protein
LGVLSVPYYPLLAEIVSGGEIKRENARLSAVIAYFGKSGDLWRNGAVLCSESCSFIVWTPEGFKFASQSFYDKKGVYYVYDTQTNTVKIDEGVYKSVNSRYSSFYGESVRSLQDKQAVDSAVELLDEAERNSAAIRSQEVSVAEQAAKDKASADRRRWMFILVGSGAIGYWIYRRYIKKRKR